MKEAERKAGVEHVPYRAAHGFRRMAAGDVLERTGNVKTALEWIGDHDLRVGQRYLKPRKEHLRDVAAMLGETKHKGASDGPV